MSSSKARFRSVTASGFLLACSSTLLAQQEVWRMDGEARADWLGLSIAVVADADGDATPDLLVGSPGNLVETWGGSVVNQVRGRASLHSGASGALLREWVSGVDGDVFGGRVADVGDVDGDGARDYGVTAPRHPTTGYASGALFIYSGADGTLLHALLNTLPTYAEHGTDVAGIGDVDGDGCSDFISSNFGFDFSPTNEAVSVISGKSGATIRTHFGPVPWTIVGLGIDLDGADDVDADGIGDYIVSAPFDYFVAPENGVAFVYSGATGQLLHTLTDPNHTEGFGWAVSGAGDVDGDGHADLLVGNPRFGANGQVLLHSGATGALLAAANGPAAGTIGFVLSRSADLDGDLVPDFAAAAQNAAYVHFFSGATGALLRSVTTGSPGAASIAAGSDLTGDCAADLVAGMPGANASDQNGAAGLCVVIYLASGATVVEVHGKSFSSDCGHALAVVPDRDGDGHREAAVAFPGGIGSNVGRVRIVSGATGGELATLASGGSGDRFGFALTSVADVDGDGVDDLAIGAPGSQGGGKVELRSGKDDSLLATISAPAGAVAFGSALATALDATGAPLLAIGDPDWRSGSTPLGLVEVHDLIGGTLRVSVTGSQSFARFGAAVSGVGDVDGDGVVDWIVGAPRENGIRANMGSVTLFSGSTGTTIWKAIGPREHGLLGSSVAAIADLDGDAIGDVLGGAPGVPLQHLEGTVTAWSGATGNVLVQLTGDAKDDAFGTAVTALGDLNRDGVDDFAVGAPAHGVNGTAAGAAYLYSGATASLLARLDGDAPDSGFGAALPTVAWLADARVDPDLIPDLLVGSRLRSNAGQPVGRAALLRLDDLYLQVDPTDLRAGLTVTLSTRGGPTSQMAGLFAVALDGAPLCMFIGLGSFDALGNWTIADTVPPSASGHALTLRSYAIGFRGKLVESQDVTLTFQ